MVTERFVSQRARRVGESGIRRIFNLAATLDNPIDFSIGQPDFDVPEAAKSAAIRAIKDGHNGYTVTQGLPELHEKISARLAPCFPEPPGVLVTSGVSGALMLALMATVDPGDEVLILDPYFVSYPNLIQWLEGRVVLVPTYPDFTLPPERIESAITSKSKIILLNSPNNPTGATYDAASIRRVCEIAEQHDLLILSDEIYDDLCYDGAAPSPVEFAPDRTIMLRGFSKTYGMTGWRMGYAAGPKAILNQMGNMQQYTFVCAPSMAQHGGIAALDCDMTEQINHYRRKRDTVAAELEGHFEFAAPSGGFFFFLKVPDRYASATAFVEAALRNNLLCVPGRVFSGRDTHFRISYAVADEIIKKGCDVLKSMT